MKLDDAIARTYGDAADVSSCNDVSWNVADICQQKDVTLGSLAACSCSDIYKAFSQIHEARSILNKLITAADWLIHSHEG